MRVAIGSDHAGFALKGELCTLLDELRIEYHDFGTFSTEAVDYPDFIAPVSRRTRVKRRVSIPASPLMPYRVSMASSEATARWLL